MSIVVLYIALMLQTTYNFQ